VQDKESAERNTGLAKKLNDQRREMLTKREAR